MTVNLQDAASPRCMCPRLFPSAKLLVSCDGRMRCYPRLDLENPEIAQRALGDDGDRFSDSWETASVDGE